MNPTNINHNKQTKNNPIRYRAETGETNGEHTEKKTHDKLRSVGRQALRRFETHRAREKLDYK
jgi:hypothetical protein